ncbi:hypothetical protein K2173_015457 [Erythroxylum novogranatense]|uniref:Cytochrome b561 and DOMON domain-containing protein n=1 Tax=Erythroxylum novogranatense TaxID=1862640 RepID=A0AAV8SRS6_9ROSI|nr:hypothetical protein K2173_015457 [Erythroxylum novogranatense]
MSPTILFVVFTLTLFFTKSTVVAHHSPYHSPCSQSFHKVAHRNNISVCKKLTTLGAEFAWKLDEHNERQIEIIFGTRLHADIGWLAWGVNPSATPQMVGTRAIIGIKQLNGSFNVNTYNITGATKLGCTLRPSSIELEVPNMSLEYSALLDYYMIHATVVLPAEYSITSLSHVWQVGYAVDGTEPMMHPATLQNVDSTEIIDLKTQSAQDVADYRQQLRVVHGILNIMAWGVLMPVGAIIARYFRYPLELEEKWWFYPHISCQITGYILGAAGWTIGLFLGRASRYYKFRTHELYAMFIFAFSTLQMLALRLRPKENNEFIKYWNMYHHSLGYALLVLMSINIFHGIGILTTDNGVWKWIYTGILSAFGIIVAAFEICSWIKFKRPKPKTSNTQKEGNAEVDPRSKVSVHNHD